VSLEHSGFANPLYSQDAASAAAGPDVDIVEQQSDILRPASASAAATAGFSPVCDESGRDTLQLVERDVDD